MPKYLPPTTQGFRKIARNLGIKNMLRLGVSVSQPLTDGFSVNSEYDEQDQPALEFEQDGEGGFIRLAIGEDFKLGIKAPFTAYKLIPLADFAELEHVWPEDFWPHARARVLPAFHG